MQLACLKFVMLEMCRSQRRSGSLLPGEPRANGLDEAVGKRLWTVSEELTGVVYPALG